LSNLIFKVIKLKKKQKRKMSKIEQGKKVKVHYTGKHESGEVFDSSQGREPLEFTVGEGQLIPGFENGVLGMETGEKKTIEVEPSQGYGDVREDLFSEVDKSQLPEGVEAGQVLQAMTNQGPMNVTVKEIKEDKAVIDANHPLAGKKIVFDLEIVEVS
jgi:FKBP-type peptidyl-prolyl cis-trans isomerase SlpA